ncbi:MAG: DNA topoisomerase (ATP-hydrolyzing) subunit B [Candidatus Altimarinota bacterium]
MAKSSGYDASKIQILEGLEAVRKRPGMYIGSTSVTGLHHMVWEILDNSIDEAMAGHCDRIVVSLNEDGSVSVEDNGRGIPVDKHAKTGKSALETIMTVLHAGGKFGGDESGYKVSGGLHGVGASVVNALSTKLIAEVYRDGNHYMQTFELGVPKGDVKVVGKSDKKGTKITFYPSPDIFDTIEFDYKTIKTRVRQQAYLTKGIHLFLSDLRQNPVKRDAFYFQNGIVSYVNHLNLGKDRLGTIFYIEKDVPEGRIEMALQYTDTYQESIYGFANNIFTPEGGMHITGFKAALTRTINTYAKKQELLKEKDGTFQAEDTREGLTAVVSVKLANPQFEGQTKSKLGNAEMRTAVESVFSQFFAEFLEENPDSAKAIVSKCMLTSRARLAAKAARDSIVRKGVLEGMTLPGKLADCSSKDASLSELFIVEGDSAGGSAKQGRDREFQAILPLKGKILNTEQARLDKVLANDEIKSLVIALGTAIGDVFNMEKLRYHKLIIMTDADVDGAHIRTLILTLFYRYFRELIDKGYVYIAQPPLYKVSKGKKSWYIQSESEKDNIVQREGIDVKNVQRYKGLGEMNPEQLWETTMDPERRSLLQVSVADAEAADRIFDILMGNHVPPRKKFIQTHARNVVNLDI